MKSKTFKKGMSLILSLLMIFTMIPMTVFTFAAEDSYPVMETYNAASSGDYHRYYNKVYSVTFLDKIDYGDISASDTLYSWDVSAAKDGSVMAWMKKNTEQSALAGADRYDVYIAGEGGVGANPDSSYIFYSFSSLEKINNPENFRTDNATTFKLLFSRCYNLQDLDLSSWNTSSVTNLNGIFDMTTANNSPIVPALKNVNLSGWDTSNVTDMSTMFQNCKSLTELDLSSFDTSKVTTMRFMFYLCKLLTHIYVGDGWTTESLANLNDGIFNCCYAMIGGKETEEENIAIYESYYPYYPVGAEYAKVGEGGYLTYAKPQPKEYTVTYEFIGDVIPEGVTAPSQAVYEEGANATVAYAPSADGYVFSGWTTEDATVENDEFTVNNDVHFVGSWSKLYKVEYKYKEGYEIPEGAPELPAAVQYKAGDWVDVNGVPYVEGYLFMGWTTEDADASGDMFIMPENDVVFYGYFKKPVESIEFTNDGDIIINKDGKTKLNVYVKPEDATIKDIVYESSDESVVTVDKYGNITAVGEGEATITVKSVDDPTKSDTITVTVKIPVVSISVTPDEVVLKKGEAEELTVYVNEDATNKGVTFVSDDKNVARVDEKGNIIAVGDGETTVTVISDDDPTKKANVKVTVKTPVTEVTAGKDFTLNVGEEKNVEAKVNEDATNKELIYESSNPGVAKVDPDGNVIAVGEGTTTITVTSKDDPTKKDTITVTVKVPVDGVVADKEDITLDVGETDKITVTVTPDGATNKGVEFESADETVATVDKDGNITAVGEGTTTITVTSKDDPTKKDTITVTVKVPVDGVVADKEDITLDVGETDKITVTVTPDGATDKGVEFESADETVATVDKDGNITAVGEGTTTITVTSKDDPTKKDTITVTVKVPVEDIIADKEDITLDVGETDKITVTVTPDSATDKGVEFESADETVATVDEDGNITAVGEGTTTITVTSKDDPTKKDTITVTVKVPVVYVPVTDITASDDFTLTIGEEKNVEASVNEDATNKELIYSSSDETVAAVDKDGKVTAVGEGTATITITSADNSEITETVAVTVKKPEYAIEAPDSITIKENETASLGVKVTPAEGAPEITYTSADEAIVKVDADGNIVGVGVGTTTVTADIGNGKIKVITVTVTAVAVPGPLPIPVKHHIAFGKTDGIGWYEVSVNGGDFFPQGPNSTLEVEKGSILVVRVQDMWIDDDFTFYVNGEKVEKDAANCITVVVDGYMLIGALSMDFDVPDVEESLNWFQKIIKAIKDFFAMIASWFK